MEISDLLVKHCEPNNRYKTGLLLLDLPTGFGKTYQTLKFIYENYKIYNRKIIFLTNLKKNLPHDTTFKDFFEKDGKLEDFEKDVIFIDSNTDSVINNIIKYEEIIPKDITELREYKNLKENIDKYIASNYKDAYEIKEKISKVYERDFRITLKEMLYKEGKTTKKRIELLKENEKYQWIPKIYPATLTSEKRVFFLSVDKFLLKNSVIVDDSHNFIGEKFLQNAIIVIDEFDASKDILLNHIINTQLTNRIDIIAFFQQIYSSLLALSLPAIYYKNSSYWEALQTKNPGLPDISKIIENIKTEAEKLSELHKIYYSLKTVGLENQRNFLFYDYKFHTIASSKNNFIYRELDDEERVNNIHFKRMYDKAKGENITPFLNAINQFIRSFSRRIRLVAINYIHLKGVNKNGEKFEFNSALASILNELNLEDKQKSFIFNIILNNYSDTKTIARLYKKDFDFYTNGFRYYDFEDNENHDTKSIIFITDYDTTPEKIVLKLAEKNMIVGISATANVYTVLGNYDLNYLRKKLGDNYLKLDDDDIAGLKAKLDSQTKNYVPIKTKFISVNDWENTLENFDFNAMTTNRIKSTLEKDDTDKKRFRITRYLEIAKVYEEFITNDNINSFLCFLNLHPQNKEDCGCHLATLEELFKAIIIKHNKVDIYKNNSGNFEINNSYIVLKSDNFNEELNTIYDTLEKGKKLFVITTYQTLGAGQNIQYKVDNFNKWLRKGKIIQTYKPEGYTPDLEKDFDAIYLDKPTNLVVNLNADEITEFGLNKRLFQAEMVYASKQLFYDELIIEVKNAFSKAYYNSDKNNYSILHKTEDYKKFVAKMVIQALGRIGRTFYKNNEIYIYANEEIANLIKSFDIDNFLVSKEFQALHQEAQFYEGTSYKDNSNKIDLEFKCICVHNWIRAKIAGKYWTTNYINEWQTLRKKVLKKPTISQKEYDNLSYWQFIYIPLYDSKFENLKRSNKYHYSEENDFSKVDINFSKKGVEVSSKAVSLNKLMKNEELKNFFTEQGYATTFKTNDYMIAPEIFNNIYKGALGEVLGKYIFEKYVISKELMEMPDELFEIFDYKIEDGVYIDFKYWSDDNSQDYKTEVDKIFGHKINKINESEKFRKLLVVNILADSKYKIRVSQNGQLIEVPYLIDSSTFEIDKKMIKKIRELLNF